MTYMIRDPIIPCTSTLVAKSRKVWNTMVVSVTRQLNSHFVVYHCQTTPNLNQCNWYIEPDLLLLLSFRVLGESLVVLPQCLNHSSLSLKHASNLALPSHRQNEFFLTWMLERYFYQLIQICTSCHAWLCFRYGFQLLNDRATLQCLQQLEDTHLS